MAPDAFTDTELGRLWRLALWVGTPCRPTLDPARVGTQRTATGEVVAAFAAGVANEDDVLMHLLGPPDTRAASVTWSLRPAQELALLSGRVLPTWIGQQPDLARLVQRARRRVVEVELERGEGPTQAAELAKSLRHSGGLEALVPLLARLGAKKLVRGWSWQDSLSRPAVFSHLIRVSFPEPEDTPEAFGAAVRAAKIPQSRLLELAAFAPQWARHAETAVGWDGLADAIWWLHAHTKDVKWIVDPVIREAWAAEVSERTPLSGQDLLDGACDVEWFARVHGRLGPARWRTLDAAARYCSSSGGHKRAQLFAGAMSGTETAAGLLARIAASRRQDAVRALGLLPLAADRDADLLGRYEAMQEFIRSSRQFGSQRQASERRAAEIGLANLARTAGYIDPLRLQWAMEARSVQDLAGDGVSASAGKVTVALTIDDAGEPQLRVTRAGRTLKTIPAAARAQPEIKALAGRVTEVRRQRRRMRSSLELMVVRAEAVSGAELSELCRHPVLFPLLGTLVLAGEGIAGYPMPDGRSLRDHAGALHAVGHGELLRIAHPFDLLAGGDWPEWQRDCLTRRERQPFKQVFRELYLLTEQEREDVTFSRRYAGHQLQPRAALALLGGRGWVAHPEEGVGTDARAGPLRTDRRVRTGRAARRAAACPQRGHARCRPRRQCGPRRRRRSRDECLDGRDARRARRRDGATAGTRQRPRHRAARVHRRAPRLLLHPPRQRHRPPAAGRRDLHRAGVQPAPRARLPAVRRR